MIHDLGPYVHSHIASTGNVLRRAAGLFRRS